MLDEIVTMSEIKLVAIDLDGTLLNSKGEISNNSVVEIQRIYKMGVHVIITTTRNNFYVCSFCEELGILDPFICSNGAQIYSKPGGTIWKQYTIPFKVASSIAKLADKNNWELSTTVNSIIYWKQRPGQKLGMVRPNIVIVEKNHDALSEEPLKILTWQIEAADALEKLCKERFSTLCKTEVYYNPTGEFHSFGIFPVDADKGTALDYVLQKLSVDRKNVMAIGDNNNDLTMLRVAELTVAMRNGTMEIKKMAKVVAPSNDEDGVAWALKKYVSDDKNL